MSVLHNWGRLTFVYQRASGSDRFVKPFGHRDATATTMASGTKLCVYRADLKAFVGKIIANQFDDIAIVLDNQDAFHGDRADRTPA